MFAKSTDRAATDGGRVYFKPHPRHYFRPLYSDEQTKIDIFYESEEHFLIRLNIDNLITVFLMSKYLSFLQKSSANSRRRRESEQCALLRIEIFSEELLGFKSSTRKGRKTIISQSFYSLANDVGVLMKVSLKKKQEFWSQKFITEVNAWHSSSAQ